MRIPRPRFSSPLRDLPTEVAVLAAVAFAVAVGFGIVAPAIPLFARDFGVGRTAAGAVISAFALMRLVSALAGGRLIDRIGERVGLAAGIGIVAVSSALAGLARSYEQLLVLRGVGGAGSALFTVAGVSLLLRVAGPAQRGRAMGVYQGGFLVGGVAGPALGGPLAEWSLRAPFFVYAATLAVAGGIGMVFLSQARLGARATPAATGPSERTTLSAALRHPGYRAALLTSFGTGWTLFGIRSSLVPLFVVEGLRRDAAWTGAALVVSSVAQALALLPAGRAADARGRRPVLAAGAALAAASLALTALSGSVWPFLLAMVLFGVGSALVGVASGAVVGDVAHARGGTVVAAYQMSSDLGAVTGPLVAGWLADDLSYGAAFGVSAGVVAAGAVLAARMPETRTAAEPSGRPE